MIKHAAHSMKRPRRSAGLAVWGGVCLAAALCAAACEQSDGGLSAERAARVSLAPAIVPPSPAALAAAAAVVPPAPELNTKTNPFIEGDTIGFFSDGGNLSSGDGDSGFTNLKMTYNGASFVSDSLVADLSRLGRYFGYFPYRQGIETPEGVSVYADEQETKVIDFLTINYAGIGQAIYGRNNFFHTFAVVRVKCGEGYKDFNGKVFLQLKRKVATIRIDRKGKDYVEDSPFTAVLLGYDTAAVKEEDRRLPTCTTEDSDGSTVWDAIVPCLPIEWRSPDDAEAGGVTIDAIVLSPEGGSSPETVIPVNNYDVFTAKLNSGNTTHGVRGGHLYTTVVKKVGLEPTVFPYDVSEWNEGHIEETVKAGIKDAGEYQSFVTAYNKEFSEDKEYTEEDIRKILEKDSALLKYGTDVNGKFTFLLTGDIDFGETDFNQDGGNSVRINYLAVPFDGRGHSITNIRMTGGFCGTLRSSLANVRFGNVSVTQPEGQTSAVGLLADKMEGSAAIRQCSVENGWLQGNGKVGAAAGTMSGGTIAGCTFGGVMRGDTTDTSKQNLVGEYTGGTIEDGSNRNNMTFYPTNTGE